MFKPNEIERLSMALDEPMKQLEIRIMSDIVRRIWINGEITRSADWQLNRLRQLGVSEQEIRSMLQESLHISDEEMNKLYTSIIKAGYARDKSLYEAVGKDFVPFKDNVGLQQLISAVADQTSSELTNITQSLGFAVRQPNGKLAFTPLATYYQQTLDGAMLDIASGAFDYNTVLKRVVKEMTNSGLRTVDYASGHSNRVDVAARRAVMTGLSQLTSKVNEDNAAALETDTYEISWHTGARPSHWWGGRWYKKDELVSVCGLGDVTGLCGANCYHDYYPVIPGVSEPTYSKDELAELNAKEKEKIAFGDKEYNKYEATQRQRRLETTMRAQRQEIKLLREGGADEDSLIEARARYRKTSDEYARFSKAMELPQQRERVTVDGLGNIGGGKYKKTVDKSAESGIIKPIDVDDYKLVTGGKGINPEINDVILTTMKQCEKDGGFVISEISDKVDFNENGGTPVLQIVPMPNRLLKLNVNVQYLSGKSLEEVNQAFVHTERNLAQSLKEAVIHESGHAISIKGKTAQEVDRLYQELKNQGKPGVSDIALSDGAELLAELEILRHRKTPVSKELSDFYEKYMGRKYL